MGDKAVNVAGLIFLAFAALWLTMALCGAALTSFIQGLGALLAALAIVSRLQIAPVLAAVCSLGIFLAPFLSGGPSSVPGDPQFQQHVALLAQPQPLRDPQQESFVFACHSQGYQDPPVLQQELRTRQQRVREWIHAHPSEVAAILKAQPSNMPPPAAQVEELAVAFLAKDSYGEGYRWMPTFLKEARAAGMDDGVKPLSADDQKAADKHAAAWLARHPNPTAMVAYENPNAGPDPERQFQSAKRGAVAWMTLWVLVPAGYFLWKGLAQLNRPFDPRQLPGWLAQGLCGLLRPTPGALPRAVAGLGVLLGGVVLMAIMVRAGVPGARAVQALTLCLGGGLLISGLNVTDVDSDQRSGAP